MHGALVRCTQEGLKQGSPAFSWRFLKTCMATPCPALACSPGSLRGGLVVGLGHLLAGMREQPSTTQSAGQAGEDQQALPRLVRVRLPRIAVGAGLSHLSSSLARSSARASTIPRSTNHVRLTPDLSAAMDAFSFSAGSTSRLIRPEFVACRPMPEAYHVPTYREHGIPWFPDTTSGGGCLGLRIPWFPVMMIV